MLFDAVSQVALFVNVFVTVYILAIVLFIALSWFRLPYSLMPLQRFLGDLCQPYLSLWRRILPLRTGGMDFSPTVGIFALIIANRVVVVVLDRLH